MAAAPDHGQPRSCGPAQGGIRLRPTHRPRRAGRLPADPAGAPRRACRGRRASPGRPGPAGARCARGGRGGAAGRSRSPSLPARVGARGGPRRDRACPAQTPGRSGRIPSRRPAARRGRAGEERHERRWPRPGGRTWPGASPTRARDRRGRPAQRAARWASRNGQDDARASSPRDPRAAHSRPGAGGHADPLGCRRASTRAGLSSIARRSARRTTPPRRPPSSAAGPGRGLGR